MAHLVRACRPPRRIRTHGVDSSMSESFTDQVVDDFACLARAYCEALLHPLQPAALAVLLADIASSALRLPDVDVDPDAPEPPDVAARRVLGLPFDIYWVVLDPLGPLPEKIGAGSLADDLADIGCDLERGLVLYDQGRARAACWEWRLGYYSHWGAHLAGAQMALFHHLHR